MIKLFNTNFVSESIEIDAVKKKKSNKVVCKAE